MRILNWIMFWMILLIIIFSLILMVEIHSHIQALEQIMISSDISDIEEKDLSTDCIMFPCYTAPHKMWVSEKYLTKGAM